MLVNVPVLILLRQWRPCILQCFCALSMNRGRSLPSPAGVINRQGISLIFMHNEEVYFGNIRAIFSTFYLTEDETWCFYSLLCTPHHTTAEKKGAVGIQHEYRIIIQSCIYKTTLFAVSVIREVKALIPHSCSLNMMVFQLF